MKNHKQILIIEPDRISGLDLQQELEKKGFSVQRPISLVDTEIIISKSKPDLVIADIDIKKETIFERIRKYFQKFKLPLIWIGVLAKKDVLKESEGLNVIGTFPKPFDSKKIVARIVKFFNKDRSTVIQPKPRMM